MPDVAIAIRILYLVDNLLNSIILIWAKNHERLITLVHHNIFAYHLAERTLVKEVGGKETQLIERIVCSISPIECKFIT